MQKVIFKDLGLIDYKTCWDYQETLFNTIIQQKTINRKANEGDANYTITPTTNYLLFCEHPHVYTLGKSGAETHLLLDNEGLHQHNAVYYKINRGGDITYHGPGQLVVYPILDLDNFFTDIHKYLRFLEEAIIITLAEYGVNAGRIEGLTGVWIEPSEPAKARKICAMGVRTSRWVTMHGLAFNVNADLTYFNNIVPCGIPDKAVTSLEKEVGHTIDIHALKERVKYHLSHLFNFKLVGT